VLDTKDARERHTIKDILRKIGEPAVPMLSEAVREGNDGAQAEASWILGLIGNPDAFDALLELSHSESWKLRSSGLNALGKLKDLSTGHQEKLLERIGEILSDETEIYYVKKDAAFAAGNQHLCGSLDLLASSLEADHYAIRFASSEAIRSLAENGCAGVAETITKGLISASPVGLIAMLHAAHTLEAGDKKDIAEAVLDLPASTEASVAYAVAKLLNTTDQEQGQGLKSTP
jgi:HEAT repeat protein